MIDYMATPNFWEEYEAALNTWPVDLGPAVKRLMDMSGLLLSRYA